MSIDTDRITAQEFEWVVNNEPTFYVEGNSFIGKVGRAPNGEDIRIKITLPTEFYPVVKPDVKILGNISHPNIDPDGTLALQLLDEWEPRYRVKDIITNTRRLFIRTKQTMKVRTSSRTALPADNKEAEGLRNQIQALQQEIAQYTQKITQVKSEKFEQGGVQTSLSSALPVSQTTNLNATKMAIEDLLMLIVDKFEDAQMDEIDFFRLYRKYIKEHYIVIKQLEKQGVTEDDVSKAQTEGPIRN